MNMNALVTWYQAQSPRDQRVAAGGAVVVLLFVIFGIFVPLDTSVSRAHARVRASGAYPNDSAASTSAARVAAAK